MYQARGTLNEFRIIGHLGKDPQIRYTTNGTAVCTMSVATTVKFPRGKDAAGQYIYAEKTNWFRAVMFGRNAEFWGIRLKKGDYVHFKGSMMQQEFTRPTDNLVIRYNELYVETAQQLGKKAPANAVTQEELDLIPPAEVAPEVFEVKPEEVQSAV